MKSVDKVKSAYPTEEELAAMSAADFVNSLREACLRPGGGMSDHPLVRGLEAGTVTLPQLRLLVEQFYLHIRNMLPWIGEIYVTCPEEDVRTTLVKNLAEECLGTFTNTGPHPELLLEFGEAIGLDVEAARTKKQLPVSRRITEYFEFMSKCRPWFVPLSAIGIGLESFVPKTFRRMVDALKKNYGIKDSDLIFWTMHITADQEHGDESIDFVSKYAVTPEARKQVYDATIETSRMMFDLWNVFADIPADKEAAPSGSKRKAA
jgi:pyrroloquinoline-quinone synthase